MPKGVYDRTKTKEQREAEKKAAPAKKVSAKAPAAAKAPKAAKAAPKAAKAVKTATLKTPALPTLPEVPETQVAVFDLSQFFAHQAHHNLGVLGGLRQALASSGCQPELLGKVDVEIVANLEILATARERMTAHLNDTASTVEETQEEAAEGSSNGVSAPALPPAPATAAPAWQPPPPAQG